MNIVLEFARQFDPELEQAPDAFQFGDSPEMADELCSLVLTGRKRATTSWPVDPSIEVGTLNVILDGAGEPAALIRYTLVEQIKFRDVPADFAAAEGEGDLSLDYWRREHWEFFTRVAEDEPFTEDSVVQCERFEVVWPTDQPTAKMPTKQEI